ncbi:MazG family protein [Thermocrinis albus DSM 14484]|uniref:Nucleoside triphosphate pyrophosphohydrolase n=1 Tax=Thermocrinis albus (strain DSM 14484 / JCM 11386 / HI 11/12) TaxID=638303 RepID=D3SQH9_THEAH|nr:nucleoside triphosphate pyrophosphohydrolase [Thermocrinis albus]ADC89416.1 MazG family protein [Thermocrinis albus DSM 14484]
MSPLEELLKTVERLRRDCPWDRKQTHESLIKYLLEETYELVDAIQLKDDAKMKEELGDLLLQVVFHAQIASERKAFDIWEVIEDLNRKLIARHPHVFGDASAEEVLKNWEENKLKERESVMDGVPRSMPALMRSQKLQDRASLVGFDFENIQQVWDKLQEELEELRQAIQNNDRKNMEHELGDVLTAVVELARFLKLDAETALQKANDRFENRFRYMERRAQQMGKDLKSMTLQEMDLLWLEAKEMDHKEEP